MLDNIAIVIREFGLTKPKSDFLLTFFATLFALRGRATTANLSRYSGLSERTFRRNYRKSWAFSRLNALLMDLLDMG